MFKHAIVRLPGPDFAQGLTTVDLGAPDYQEALRQHGRYCEALRACGLTVTVLDTDPYHPDATFVEDTAVLTERGAILTRPGAKSREGEVASIGEAVRGFFPNMPSIEPPGTLDGGDICEAGGHFFLGLSHRTNEEGARQLAGYLGKQGYTSGVVDVRGLGSILHLKSGLSYIGNHTLVVIPKLAGHPLLRDYELIRVGEEESYAANCVRVNDRVLVPAGYPLLTAELNARGFRPLPLEMSEFRKMDGGLSCLSLRF